VDQRMRVTAGIVEDHPVVIEGITSWISADPEERIQVVLVAHDLMALEPVTGPVADVIILDLELNGKLVTSQLARLVAAGNRIVAFSAHADPGLVRDVLDGGAHAYVAKDEGREYLVEAVLAAAADRPCVTRSQAKAFLGDTGPGRPSLSVQERQALLLWFQGMSKASVGRRMSITENTVRQYIDRARMKYAALGRPALSKDALLARAIEDGIITPREVATYTSRASRLA
jgi:two-component system nitrate/nitrite response regulator NarL